MTCAFAKARDAIRELGLFFGLLYLANRALQGISLKLRITVFEFVAQPVPDRPLLPPRFSKGLTHRLIERGNPELQRMPPPPAVIEARFAQGARCLGAYRGGALVGYIWFCSSRYEEDMARCDYVLADPASCVFDFDLYIPEEHRMGLGFAAVWQVANEHLRGLGVRHSLSRIDRFNVASLRAHQRLGARSTGRALFCMCGPLQVTVATLRPYLHLSFSSRRRCQFTLGA